VAIASVSLLAYPIGATCQNPSVDNSAIQGLSNAPRSSENITTNSAAEANSANSFSESNFEMSAPVSDLPTRALDFIDAAQNHNLDTLSASHLLLSGMENAQSIGSIAIKQFEEVIRREPQNVSAHNNLAVCLKRQGNNKAALEEFKKAIENNPTRCELFNNLAHSYISAGQYDLAVEALYKALRLNPDFAEAHRNLGHVLALKGDNDAP
jgi:Flp pilus assembly protein TadD